MVRIVNGEVVDDAAVPSGGGKPAFSFAGLGEGALHPRPFGASPGMSVCPWDVTGCLNQEQQVAARRRQEQ